MDEENVDIEFTTSGLNGRETHTVPEGTTIADLRAQGMIGEGVVVRQAGQDVSDSTDIRSGANYVLTPPAAKHG